MWSFLFFIFVIRAVTSEVVVCNSTQTTCDKENHVICNKTDNIFLGNISADILNEIRNNVSSITHEMIRLTAVDECGTFKYTVTDPQPVTVECQCKNLTNIDCEFSNGITPYCIHYIQSELIEGVDFNVTLEDYHLILFGILLFGLYTLNISMCIVIKTLARY